VTGLRSGRARDGQSSLFTYGFRHGGKHLDFTRGRILSRGCVHQVSLDLRGARRSVSRLRSESRWVTRVHGAPREGHAQRSSNSAPAFSRVLRPTTRPVHASGTLRAQAAASESWLAGSRCGDASGSQRNRHRLVPASSGAKSSTRARGSRARWVCPRVVFGCRNRRAAPRSREARPRRQRGSRERGSDLRPVVRLARIEGVDSRHRGRPAATSSQGRRRTLERASQGKGLPPMEGVSGPPSSASTFTRSRRG
jgi:hypothetical protein